MPATTTPAAAKLDAGSIGTQRRALERQLADLRRARGKAIADGKTYDPAKIAAVQEQLDALDDADAEAGRRAAVKQNYDTQEFHRARMAAYSTAFAARSAAVGKLEIATRALGDAMAAAIQANEAERAAVGAFSANGVQIDAALTPINFENRVWAHARSVLRAAIGKRWFGPLDLAPRPGDIDPTEDWAKHEAGRGDVRTYLDKFAP